MRRPFGSAQTSDADSMFLKPVDTTSDATLYARRRVPQSLSGDARGFKSTSKRLFHQDHEGEDVSLPPIMNRNRKASTNPRTRPHSPANSGPAPRPLHHVKGHSTGGIPISREALAKAEQILNTSSMPPVNPYSKDPYSLKRKAEDAPAPPKPSTSISTTAIKPSNPYARRTAATARKAPQEHHAQSRPQRPATEPRHYRPPAPTPAPARR